MDLNVWFDHGFGDVVQFATLLQLYKRRGYDVRCHFEENKRPVFDAAGIPYWDQCKNYHHWRYYPGFNHPDPAIDGSGNKTYLNFNTEILPSIGNAKEQWEELCSIDLESSFDPIISPESHSAADKFLAGLPRPIVLLHTRGTNFQQEKSFSDEVTNDLYRQLLDGMPGTLVLLDWDYRVPNPPHGRIRHIKRDWGHISILDLAALMQKADLLIGIDSGPWHMVNMTRIPALGVFHDFFPWCVSLPRPSGRSAVLTRDSHHHCTIHRRQRWNPLEYPAPMPKAADITRHALRMLEGPRYGLPIGRDVMLQQLIRDLNRSSTSTSPIADRNNTLDQLFQMMGEMPAPAIVETGCIRGEDDWSAGYFGYLAGAWVYGRGVGSVLSVDNNDANLATARNLCRYWPNQFVHSDSVAYLKDRVDPIDVLYLDALDCEHAEHSAHGLREIQAADRLLHARSILIYDDTVWNGQWAGKGALGVPWALANGYEMVGCGYQAILRKR